MPGVAAVPADDVKRGVGGAGAIGVGIVVDRLPAIHPVCLVHIQIRVFQRAVIEGVGVRNHVGCQPLIAGRILANDHTRLLHRGFCVHRRLDFAKLDP